MQMKNRQLLLSLHLKRINSLKILVDLRIKITLTIAKLAKKYLRRGTFFSIYIAFFIVFSSFLVSSFDRNHPATAITTKTDQKVIFQTGE